MVSLPSFYFFYYFFARLTSDLFIFSVSVNSVIAAGDLELPSGDEEGETHVELPAAEATLSGRKNKREKKLLQFMRVLPSQTLQVKSSRVLSFLNPVLSFLSYVLIVFIACFFAVESPPPPPAKSKRLRKRTVVEYVATLEPAIVPTTTSPTDEELREAFEAVEQEKE